MRIQKVIGYIIVGLMMLSTNSNATTIFARQYDVKCTTCHIGTPPMLNSTGQAFFRNGFKFSKDDVSTLKKALSSENRLIPIGLFIGGGYKNAEMTISTPKGNKVKINEVTNPTASLFFSASINSNWSAFVGGKFAYLEEDPLSSTRTLKMLRKKFYVQYSGDDVKNVTRVGLLSVYSQFGNVDKGSEYAGLNDAGDIFLTPLAIANEKFIYGFDYTYQMDNGVSFLVAGGELDDSNKERDLTLGMSYFNQKNFRISAIINKITATDTASNIKKYTPQERRLGERTTVIIPIEYSTNFAYLNTAVVYSNVNKKPTDGDYYGWETSLTIPIFDIGKVRAIFTTDNNGDVGYSLGYSQIFYQSLMLSASYSKFTTSNADFKAIGVSLSYIY